MGPRASPDRASSLAELDRELRTMGARSVMLSQATASVLRISPTDLETMDLLSLHGPLAAGRIAELTGLDHRRDHRGRGPARAIGIRAPGARRHRPAAVIVHLVPDRARAVGKLSQPLARAMADLHRRCSDEQLALLVDYTRRANAVALEHNRPNGAGTPPATAGERAMLNVGLTGNIAAGKSTVAGLFQRWGATIIDADEIVREVQAPGGAVLREIVLRFGDAVLRPDGSLDRAALRRRVLADSEALAALNRIVHPAVHFRHAELLARAASRGDRVVVSDIPLLFEATDPGQFDVIVLVDAPEEVRLARLVEHRGLEPDEARGLIRAQLPAGDKRARSDFVIENDGDPAALERAARAVWRALSSRA